ncbi:MAG: preprotein translocase subunit SecE [Nitrospinota bacterium]
MEKVLGSIMGGKGSNPVKNGVRFVTEARNELRKVSWPTRKDTTSVTVVVIALVFIIGFYLAIIDWGLSQVIQKLIR